MTAPVVDLVAVDVGNSKVAAALLAGREVTARARFRHAEPGALAALAEFLARAPAAAPVALASVNAEALAALLPALAARRVAVAPRDFSAAIDNACTPPESVGQDRLFDAAGAAERYPLPAVVVDAGTAVTVNRVDPGPTFRGGAIAPGLELAFEVLHRRTSQLPRVATGAAGAAVPALGTDTAAAIRSGVVRGVAGAIDRLCRDLAASCPGGRAACFVLTGGAARTLLPFLETDFVLDPDLQLRGIAAGFRARRGAVQR